MVTKGSLEWLVALEEIRMLRTRYSRLIDAHKWEGLAEVLAPDCRMDLSQAAAFLGATDADNRRAEGRAEIISFLNASFSSAKMTLHIATLPEIEFDGDDRAHGIWRQETYVKEACPELPGCGIAYGTVWDEYVRLDRRWYIQSVTVGLDMVM